MAHFALVDNQIVREVIAVDNVNCDNAEFPESEPIGQSFIASSGLTGLWLETSYHNNFRGTYAAIGYTYDPDLDIFVAPTTEEETA